MALIKLLPLFICLVYPAAVTTYDGLCVACIYNGNTYCNADSTCWSTSTCDSATTNFFHCNPSDLRMYEILITEDPIWFS